MVISFMGMASLTCPKHTTHAQCPSVLEDQVGNRRGSETAQGPREPARWGLNTPAAAAFFGGLVCPLRVFSKHGHTMIPSFAVKYRTFSLDTILCQGFSWVQNFPNLDLGLSPSSPRAWAGRDPDKLGKDPWSTAGLKDSGCLSVEPTLQPLSPAGR